MKLLTKSDIVLARECPYCFWMLHNSTQAPVYPAGMRLACAQGDDFEAYVTGELGHALRVPPGPLEEAARVTQELRLAHPHTTLLQPAFVVAELGLGVRLDALCETQCSLQMLEAKASKSIRAAHLDDCAIQLYVARAAGIPVNTVMLAYVNRRYRQGGDLSLSITKYVTPNVEARLSQVPHWVEDARAVLDLTRPPERAPHHDCYYPCLAPIAYPVALLPCLKERKHILARGITDVRQVPFNELGDERNRLVTRAVQSARATVMRETQEQLAWMGEPSYFLDFETVAYSVPRFAHTACYEAVPVQFSCHQQTDGKLTHTEFLWDNFGRPHQAFARALLAATGTEGPVFVYGTFERTIIKGLIENVPEAVTGLRALRERCVDMLAIVRAGFYHPAMHGHYSIKNVLACLPGKLSYAALPGEVQRGTDIQAAWTRMAEGGKREGAKALLAYCALDTLALHRLVTYLCDARNGPQILDHLPVAAGTSKAPHYLSARPTPVPEVQRPRAVA